MFIKSRSSIKCLVLNCLISIACNASAPEVIDSQIYVPNEPSLNQKMLVLFGKYHMGDLRIIATILALVPVTAATYGIGTIIVAAPLVGSVAGNTLDVTLNSAPSTLLELPKLVQN